jgi:hypothetical protein
MYGIAPDSVRFNSFGTVRDSVQCAGPRSPFAPRKAVFREEGPAWSRSVRGDWRCARKEWGLESFRGSDGDDRLMRRRIAQHQDVHFGPACVA